MEATKSKGKYWLYFFIWLAIILFMLIKPDLRQWFWLALPGVVTYFAYALDIVE
jgi:Na+-transporting NADH:ubiquinone oxidoreductase subunit NqrB